MMLNVDFFLWWVSLGDSISRSRPTGRQNDGLQVRCIHYKSFSLNFNYDSYFLISGMILLHKWGSEVLAL